MFNPLPQYLKEKLKQITTEYNDGDYIQNNQQMVSIIDELKDAGYLRKFKRYLHYSYGVKFSYEDLNYDFLEEQYNIQFTSGNNITVHGGTNQFNTANAHGTVNATQNIEANYDMLNKLIEEILKSAPKDNDEQLETITRDLREIQNQVISGNPNKRFLDLIFGGLNGIANSVANCTGFVENLSKLHEFLQTIGIL